MKLPAEVVDLMKNLLGESEKPASKASFLVLDDETCPVCNMEHPEGECTGSTDSTESDDDLPERALKVALEALLAKRDGEA